MFSHHFSLSLTLWILESFYFFQLTIYDKLRPVLFYSESACCFVMFMFENIVSLLVDVVLYRLEKI